MERLIAVNSPGDIPENLRQMPAGLLLEYHNLDKPYESYESARLLIGMCMDNRKHLHIPENFAYIIRSGGANLRYSEFKISYAIAVGNVSQIVLIGHNNCGMVNLHARKDQIISGLVEKAGWQPQWAEDHFNQFAPLFEIGNEVDFVIAEAKRLRIKYPKISVVPMVYLVENNRLYLVQE
jgi:carbonic anhydrase